MHLTLKDIANVLGVNVSTVSRALDPKTRHRVSTALTEKIRKAASDMGYRPNAAAYALKTNKTRTIGVVIPDITDPVFPPIIRGIEEGLERHGYVALLANTDGDARREARIIETFNARGVDGFILASLRRHDPAVSKSTAGRPVVTVTRTPDNPRFSSVVHDEAEGVRHMVAHLVALGHRAFATIAGPQTISTGFERLRAYQAGIEAAGLRVDKALRAFATTFSEAEGERCTEELLATRRPFTALVCANDRLAIGAIAALQRNGVNCPADVSVTGFNDMPFAGRLQPPLTTIRIQHHKAGIEAAEIIVRLSESSSEAATHTVMPTELIVRESSGAASDARRASILSPPSAASRAGTSKVGPTKRVAARPARRPNI